MKIIKSTNKTSIRGVMLISDFRPPSPPPTPIDIKISLKFRLSSKRNVGRPKPSTKRSLFVDQLRKQTQLIHADRTKSVHHILNFFVLGTQIRLDVNRLVQ